MTSTEKLAIAAGFTSKDAAGAEFFECWPEALERFAELIRANLPGALAEREACAALAEKRMAQSRNHLVRSGLAVVALDIRARTLPAPTNKESK